MKRLAIAGMPLVLALGCGGGPKLAAPSPVSIAQEPREKEPLRVEAPVEENEESAQKRRQMEEMLAQVSSIRALLPKSPIKSEVLDRPALLDRVRAHVAEEVPKEVIEAQGELLVALGLVPTDFDYERAIFQLLESQLAGFYRPQEKAMFLAADLSGESATATLAHELVHALQDQHWDLGPRLAYAPGEGDRQSALHALAEGDATSAMMDFMLAPTGKRAMDLSDNLLSLEAELSMAMSREAEEIPRVLRASLAAPYVDGLAFVHALRRRGGWAAVDEAWRSPPTTTEQLLHIEKYDTREAAEPLPKAAPPAPGWEAVHEDALGEQSLRIVLEEWAPKRVARVAAAGWGGDLATLFQLEDAEEAQFALLWRLRFDEATKGDPDAEADEAFAVLSKALGESSRGNQGCTERPDLGPFALLRSGRDVVVAAGPYARRGERTVSRGECAQTLRWASQAAQSMRGSSFSRGAVRQGS